MQHSLNSCPVNYGRPSVVSVSANDCIIFMQHMCDSWEVGTLTLWRDGSPKSPESDFMHVFLWRCVCACVSMRSRMPDILNVLLSFKVAWSDCWILNQMQKGAVCFRITRRDHRPWHCTTLEGPSSTRLCLKRRCFYSRKLTTTILTKLGKIIRVLCRAQKRHQLH